MSVLSGTVIRRRLRSRGANRIVVAPILEPLEQLRKDRASIDVRLGQRFTVARTVREGIIDSLSPGEIAPTETFYVPVGDRLVLHPHQFVIAETLEFIRVPGDLMGYVVGRSSWGRVGLIVATAVGIHPWFCGPITLELRNVGEVPLRLYPGDPIAQLFFHITNRGGGNMTNVPSQFAGASGPVRGKLRYPGTEAKLRVLLDSRKTAAATEIVGEAAVDVPDVPSSRTRGRRRG